MKQKRKLPRESTGMGRPGDIPRFSSTMELDNFTVTRIYDVRTENHRNRRLIDVHVESMAVRIDECGKFQIQVVHIESMAIRIDECGKFQIQIYKIENPGDDVHINSSLGKECVVNFRGYSRERIDILGPITV